MATSPQSQHSFISRHNDYEMKTKQKSWKLQPIGIWIVCSSVVCTRDWSIHPGELISTANIYGGQKVNWKGSGMMYVWKT